MSTVERGLLSRGLWTVGTFGGSFALKLGNNVILAKLLAPEVFGVMLIVNSIKYGIELLTDVGIEQNIVSHKNGAEPNFFNTAWTMQIIRGILLTSIFAACSPLLSQFFKISLNIFLVISFAPLINSLASTSVFILVKDMKVKQRNLFELICELIAFTIYVALAIVTPTVWALVIGVLCSLAVRSALSYLIPHPTHFLTLRRNHVKEIIRFGKWIMISSLVVYAATNFDRIYLGKTVRLEMLGIYGIARTIAEIPPALAGRLSYQLVFPLLAAKGVQGGRADHSELSTLRWKFLIIASMGLATLTAWADCAINLVYDTRYQQAGGIMFVLLIGAWFSIMSNLNEATVLGRGRPALNSFANMLRLIFLIVCLPVGYALCGFLGAIVAIALSECIRYALVFAIQIRLKFSFGKQDFLATLVGALVLLAWIIVRQNLHLDVPWHTLTKLSYGSQ